MDRREQFWCKRQRPYIETGLPSGQREDFANQKMPRSKYPYGVRFIISLLISFWKLLTLNWLSGQKWRVAQPAQIFLNTELFSENKISVFQFYPLVARLPLFRKYPSKIPWWKTILSCFPPREIYPLP